MVEQQSLASVRLNPNDILFLNQQIASMARLNMPLAKGLRILARDVEKPLKHVIEALQQDLDEGHSLQESLAKYPQTFSALHLEIVKAGESTGNLAVILDELNTHTKAMRRIRQQIIEAAADLKMMVVPEGGSMFFHNLSMILDGHTTLEHALPVAPLYEDVLQLFAASKTAYNPTLVVGYGGIWGENYWYEHTNVFANKRLLNFVPRSLVDPRSRRRTKFPEKEWHHFDLAKSAATLKRRGVVTSVSAHGQMQGICSHWDLWMFHQGGLSTHEALQTATINGARALGLDKHVGSLLKGKLADLIVLNSNPLEDIRKSEDIAQVMKNGRLYNAMTLAQVYPKKTKAPKLPFLGVVHRLGSGCSCHVVR